MKWWRFGSDKVFCSSISVVQLKKICRFVDVRCLGFKETYSCLLAEYDWNSRPYCSVSFEALVSSVTNLFRDFGPNYVPVLLIACYSFLLSNFLHFFYLHFLVKICLFFSASVSNKKFWMKAIRYTQKHQIERFTWKTSIWPDRP